MLTCDAVRNALPGLATGERPSHEVREHLARCDACREARDRLARDVSRIRHDLAALAPTPLLEDAAVDTARTTEIEPRSRRPWRYVATAVAATAALFLVVVLPRLQDSAPGGTRTVPGGDTATATIYISSSEAEVDANRRENAKVQALVGGRTEGRLLFHEWVTPGRGVGMHSSQAFEPPLADVHHRFVYGDDAGRPGTRTYTLPGPGTTYEEGVFLLGMGLLNEIGGRLEKGSTTAIIANGKRWEMAPENAEAEIYLAAPHDGGAEGRIRVAVNPGYGGTLLVEGPLTRALGLHQFEIPGEVVFTGQVGQIPPLSGHRTRARVRIPELDVDRVVEVQVAHSRPWRGELWSLDAKAGIQFEGEAPTDAMSAAEIVFDARGRMASAISPTIWGAAEDRPVRFWHIAPDVGTRRFIFGFAGVPPGKLPQIPDTPAVGHLFRHADATVVPRALDFGARTVYVMNVVRTTLDGTWEKGASVTVARVWRGTTAIPSREAVVQTTVDEMGRISFPRIPGEKGSTLRMLVTTKDGTSTFHDIEIGPVPIIWTYVGADGSIGIDGTTIELFDEAGMGVVAGLVSLREILRKRAASPNLRDENTGEVRLTLGFRIHPEAPWRAVQWALQVMAEPTIGMHRFQLAAHDGAPMPFELPRDRRLGAPPQRPESLPFVTVKVFRRQPEGPAHYTVGQERIGEAPAEGLDPLVEAIRRVLEVARARGGTIQGQLKAPRPTQATFGDVQRALRALREAGIEDVRFEGAPAPLPGR